MAGVEMEFFLWLDGVPARNVMPWPAARALKAIEKQAADAGVWHGRVTLWLWQAKGKKMALGMGRRLGLGGAKAVNVVRREPPFQDADKAEMVFKAERE